MNQAERLTALGSVPVLLKQAIINSEGTGELVDVLGLANSIQTRIGTLKRGAASEVENEDAGDDWVFTQGREAKRSYNTSGILGVLLSTPEIGIDSIGGLLNWLMAKNVIRIQWNWTPLERLIKDYNLDLRVVRREIEDGDPDAEIGEWWKNGSPSYKRVKTDA